MASITEGGPRGLSAAGELQFRRIGGGLVALGAAVGVAVTVLLYAAPDQLGVPSTSFSSDWVMVPVFGLGLLLIVGGAVVSFRRPGPGGTLAVAGSLLWLSGLLLAKAYSWWFAGPAVLGIAGGVLALAGNDWRLTAASARIVYRQSIFTRVTHWVWAVAMFFLLASGLQIFNARPNLYIGQQSGFGFDNQVLELGAENTPNGPRGFTTLFGQKFDTTGVLGMSGTEARPNYVGFPAWATIPSFRDLATGRVVHFFFAWMLVGALAVWLAAGLLNRHIWRDVILKPRDFRGLPKDIVDHVLLRFHHTRTYSPLQKVAYFAVFFILFPLIMLTGLTMSPGMDAAWPWLVDLFGGRQTARTIHFVVMLLLVLFFVVHIIMVVLAGPLNELRSMITGFYKTSAPREGDPHE